MASRIYDPSALDRQSGDITLSLDISETYPVPNADGTPAQATFKIEARTIRLAILALDKINPENDESDIFISALMEQAFMGLNIADGDETEDFNEPLKEAITSTDEWREMSLELTISTKDTKDIVIINMKAPSYQIMSSTFAKLSSKKRLTQLANSFMPLADDENDWDDE